MTYLCKLRGGVCGGENPFMKMTFLLWSWAMNDGSATERSNTSGQSLYYLELKYYPLYYILCWTSNNKGAVFLLLHWHVNVSYAMMWNFIFNTFAGCSMNSGETMFLTLHLLKRKWAFAFLCLWPQYCTLKCTGILRYLKTMKSHMFYFFFVHGSYYFLFNSVWS